MSTADISVESLLEQRNAMYKFLARMFQVEVDQEFYDFVCSMAFPAHTGNADVDDGQRLICSYLSTPRTGVLTELAVDYTRTFIGAGNDGYSAAYPFESVYTSPKRLLMQGARDEVLVIYRANGIDKSDSWKDGEDHIALELEFMQIIGERLLDAFRSGQDEQVDGLLQTQRHFLEDHLLAWYPMMAADIDRFAKTDFYRGLGLLAMGFLTTDLEFLEGVLEEGEGKGDGTPAERGPQAKVGMGAGVGANPQAKAGAGAGTDQQTQTAPGAGAEWARAASTTTGDGRRA